MLIFLPLALYAGFDTRRQEKSNLNRIMIRYKQLFGVDPLTAAPLFRDLRSKFQSFNYKDGLMTLNWLYLNDKRSVLMTMVAKTASNIIGGCSKHSNKLITR
jgi:hypothetical protein